jgi:uncharacterized YccA/Bax inhibitor family protein
MNGILGLGLAVLVGILWTKVSDRSHHLGVLFLLGAIMMAVLTPLTFFLARGLAKGLTAGAEYRKEVMWTVWYGLSVLLVSCYTIMMNLLLGLIDLSRSPTG